MWSFQKSFQNYTRQMLHSDDTNIQISCSLSLVMLKYIVIYKIYIWQQQKYVPYYCQQAKSRNVFGLKEFNTVHLYLPQYNACDDKQRGELVVIINKSLILHFCTSNKKPSMPSIIIIFSPLLLTLSCYIFEHLSVLSSSCKGSNPLEKNL